MTGRRARLRRWLRSMLVAEDQWWAVALAGPKFIMRGGRVPDPDETISSIVGRMAARGHRWALIAEPIIDRLFIWVGQPPRHCRRNIEILPPLS